MKVDRAKVHLDELEVEHRRLIQDGTYTITKKDYPKKFIHVLKIEAKRMSPLIAILAGEFAYSLRSGLDQLAWSLAFRHLKRRPRSATSFPIRSVVAPAPKGFGECTKDIPPAALSVIESFQPYKRGARYKTHPLWILNELCITDKHVTLPVNSTACRFTISNVSDWSRRDFQHAVEVTIPLSEKYKVQLDPEQPEIILGEPLGSMSSGFEVRVAELRPIHEFVRDELLPAFAGFFK